MIQKLKDRFSRSVVPVSAEQSSRQSKEVGMEGEVIFTITGTRKPGFFVIFGSFFLLPPLFIIATLVFSKSSPESASISRVFGLLFLVPFLLIGAGSLLTGLFLWFGRTRILIGPKEVRVERSLFGKIFHQKVLPRDELKISFAESHRNNEIPVYQLRLRSGREKIGLGGSLKESGLLWLNEEIRSSLGEDLDSITTSADGSSVADIIAQNRVAEILDDSIIENYRSKNLQITRTTSGWQAVSRYTFGAGFTGVSVGVVFVFMSLFMEGSLPSFVIEKFPILSDQQSPGLVPFWGAAIFKGLGGLSMIGGIWLLGIRRIISLKHSRLELSRKWLGVGSSQIYQLSSFLDFQIKETGHVNDVPCFRLDALQSGNRKTKILGFSSAEDIAQIRARLIADLS